ncbi:MAG: hypothetical protein K0T99_00055 [Alphaproteobacteria bacterium]|nr:hypothetical protein [Alphaproteobacteria bacterium]
MVCFRHKYETPNNTFYVEGSDNFKALETHKCDGLLDSKFVQSYLDLHMRGMGQFKFGISKDNSFITSEIVEGFKDSTDLYQLFSEVLESRNAECVFYHSAVDELIVSPYVSWSESVIEDFAQNHYYGGGSNDNHDEL